MFKKIVIVLCLALWPLNLYLTNSFSGFLSYSVPGLLLLSSYFLYIKFPKYYLIPVILISVIQINLLPFSLIFCLIHFFQKRKFNDFIAVTALLASLIVLIFNFSNFKNITIFIIDERTRSAVESNINLYSDHNLAKLFQNDQKVAGDRLVTQFFDLIDPVGYFFGTYPRPMTADGRAIIKLSFLTAPFLFFGILKFKNKNINFVINSFASSIFSLMLLSNFQNYDFILWLPISLIIIEGIRYTSLKYPKLFTFYSFILIIYSVPEYLRNFIYKNE